jgi:hypothetical protein
MKKLCLKCNWIGSNPIHEKKESIIIGFTYSIKCPKCGNEFLEDIIL